MNKKILTGSVAAVLCTICLFSSCDNGKIHVSDDPTVTLDSSGTGGTNGANDITTSADNSVETTTDNTNGESETTSVQSPETTTTPNMSGTDQNLLTLTAQGLLGIPFAVNGASPETGFDSSGFIYYVLKENGYIHCSRAIGKQAEMGDIIKTPGELKSGDLVFFSENKEKPQFGGIYIGDGIMITCSVPGDVVKEVDITSNYYISNFFVGVRVL